MITKNTLSNKIKYLLITVILLSYQFIYSQQLEDRNNKNNVISLFTETPLGKLITWMGNLIGAVAIIYCFKNAFELLKKINQKKQQGQDEEEESSTIKDFLLRIIISLIIGFGTITFINFFLKTI